MDSSLPDIKNNIYITDEFHMYSFKESRKILVGDYQKKAKSIEGFYLLYFGALDVSDAV